MRKVLSLFTVLVLLASSAMAQTRTITGKVVDAAGLPVSNASIVIKGTSTGVSADANGNFSITAKTGDVLVISAIGTPSKEVTVTSESSVTVTLTRQAETLSEVVVTGVGTATSKRRVAIDVSTVSSKDFAKSATASVEQSIMGQIAGAQIQQTSGQPNSGFNIILRGVNALGGTYPMILLDGIEITDLSVIDPNTVERVEVVKGAAAGMLYGAQGANGVIQVFTKKGSKNRMSITASTKFSWDKVLRNKEIIASKHHYVTDAEGYVLDGNGNRIHQDEIGAWPDPQEEDFNADPEVQNNKVYKEPTYDHIDQSFRQAFSQTHSVSMSGGANKVDYALTASYLNQQDVYSNTFKRGNISLNLGLELFKGFTIRSNTQTIFSEDKTLTNPNSRFALINSFAFIDFMYRDSLGNLVMQPRNNENQHNPLSEAEWHENTFKPQQLIQNVELNYNLPKFVSVNYKFGMDRTITEALDYYHNQTTSLPYILTGSVLPWGNNPTGSILKYQSKETFINSLASVFVKTDFEKDFHMNTPIRTTTQLAYDYRKNTYSFFGAQGSGLPSYGPYNINVATSTVGSDFPGVFLLPPYTIPGTFITYGILVNQSVDYGNLFGVSGGFRSDYSSEFGQASDPFTFYRGMGYFRPSELLKSNLLTDWKLRAAYGEAGIQPGRYQRQTTFSVAPLGSGVSIFNPNTARNPALQVQVSKELELGTDATFKTGNGMWISKVTFSGTYWKRTSDNIIQDAQLAISTGYTSKTDNLTTISSKGFDLTLDATMLTTRAINWTFGYRMGFAKSMVDRIANGRDITAGPFTLKQGYPVGELYGQYAITDINALRSDKTPYIDDADKQYYVLVNGIVTDTRTNTPLLSDANDLKSYGNVYPKFTAAFINTITIKNDLTIAFQFDWYHGNKIYNISRQWLYRDRISADFDQPVTIGGKTGAYVAWYNGFYNSVSPSDWFAEDGSFIRLRNASISYNFAKLIKMDWVRSAELFVAGRNLWTSSKYKGLDPENTSSTDSQGNDVSTSVGGFKGVDYFGVPNTRSYMIGLTLSF